MVQAAAISTALNPTSTLSAWGGVHSGKLDNESLPCIG